MTKTNVSQFVAAILGFFTFTAEIIKIQLGKPSNLILNIKIHLEHLFVNMKCFRLHKPALRAQGVMVTHLCSRRKQHLDASTVSPSQLNRLPHYTLPHWLKISQRHTNSQLGTNPYCMVKQNLTY